jgi:YbgC/YbaW family acyl-CoA thioester hydrolase
MHEYRTTRRIEFSDTDLAGVVHFARFFIFMETAEDEFLRQLGASFTMNDQGRSIGWPKVSASCDYHSPARYGDTLDIHLSVQRVSQRTITYEFVFSRGDTEIALGRTTSACVVINPDGTFSSVPIPAALAGRIEPAPR